MSRREVQEIKNRETESRSRRLDRIGLQLLDVLQKEIVMRITMIILMVMMFSSNVFAERVRTRGDRTDTDLTSEKNDAGVTTRKSSRGGEAKTKSGKGVYKSPGGK